MDKASSSSSVVPVVSHSFSVSSCPIGTVTVYRDRAEITRTLSLKGAPGQHEVVLQGLSPHIVSSSIRASGMGPATVLEVSYQEKYYSQGEMSSEESKELEALMEEEKLVVQSMERAKKEKEWLAQYAITQQGAHGESVLSMEDAAKFLEFYSAQMAKSDERALEMAKRKEGLREKMKLLNSSKKVSSAELKREVAVALQCNEEEEVQLQLSYVVNKASWQSSYDVRVVTEKSQHACQLTYHGVIVNETGEDWNDVSLALSTASPSLGGQPPQLPTAKVIFEEEQRSRAPTFMMDEMDRRRSISVDEESFGRSEEKKSRKKRSKSPSPPMEVMTTTVQEGLGTATYTIPRHATIASDSKPHKVTVAVLDLKATISYVTVPVLSPHVFMKAVATNTSDYQFLPGTLNVFLGNFFISQSRLEHSSPGEDIELWLGADSTIKAELKPTEEKDGKTAGILRKGKSKDTKIAVVVKNTKKETVEVTVLEQLPLSSDDRVKVKLVEPEIKPGNPKLFINENSNISWTVAVKAEEEVKLRIHYVIEYPQEKKILIVNQS